MKTNPILLAVDVSDLSQAADIIAKAAPYVGGIKVGLELITAVGGPQVVEFVQIHGGKKKVFYDGKIFDITNTMVKACSILAKLGVMAFNIHASTAKAVAAVAAVKGQSKLWTVTVLTSLTPSDLMELNAVGLDSASVQHAVLKDQDAEGYLQHVVACRTAIAVKSGADGVICSGRELDTLRNLEFMIGTFDKVVPGTRSVWAPSNDQARVITPAEAIRLGATHLVIGRQITDPQGGMTLVQAAQRTLEEIESAAS